ncbi:putative cysteine peptidase [Mycoplasmopsis synoviae]|nr:hypothetical protein [Mycoplasmopsis synoviae]AKB10948.1 hypothetical protein VY93_00915 [Mycoplasmopsis synoviae ATCC 25204]
MKKFKKKINILLFSSISTTPFLVALSMNIKENNSLLDNEIKKIKSLIPEAENVIFHKEIQDIKNKKLLLIVFDNYYSVLDIDSNITIEINNTKVPIHLVNMNIIYGGFLGILTINENKYFDVNNIEVSYDDIEKAHITIDKNREKPSNNIKIRKKRSNDTNNNYPYINYDYNGVFKVSTTVPYSWWFASRDNKEKSGYVDLSFDITHSGEKGLCEYVALSQLMLYNEIFIKSGIFSKEKFDFYTKDSGYDKILENSSPVFRYHLYNKPESSLAMTLFNNAGKKLNLKTGQLYETAIKKFINNNDEINKWNFNHKYGGYKKTWEYVKKGVPTILGVAPTGGFWPNHAYIMYGYDDKTDMFLGSMAWGQKRTNSVLYSYYTSAWGSYYFNIELKNKKDLGKVNSVFKFYDTYFTGKTIDNFIKSRTSW